jgi:hypothetical protein
MNISAAVWTLQQENERLRVELERLKPVGDAAVAYVRKYQSNGGASLLDEWVDLFNAVQRLSVS